MHIFFNGCSYTWGDELENREEERYSRVVSTHYNAQETNIAANGNSNDAIARTTMEWFAQGNTCDLAVIQWTVISRFETYKDQYVSVTVQNNNFKSFYADYYEDKVGVDAAFKNAYLLEQFFISRGIKYIFLWHDCFVNWSKTIEKEDKDERWQDYGFFVTILDTPCVWRDLLTNKNFSFMRANLANEHKSILTFDIDFVASQAHPNPQGHQKIAQRIISQI